MNLVEIDLVRQGTTVFPEVIRRVLRQAGSGFGVCVFPAAQPVACEGNEAATWKDRPHFFRAAAQAMRQILIDRARAKQRFKRGAGPVRVRLDEVNLATETEPDTLLLVDEAIEALARQHPEQAELVKLRFYVGL